MPNGFCGDQKDWDRIEGPLKRLDKTLEQFAEDHHLILKKNERNDPNRTFRWGVRPNLLIQVFNESEEYLTYTMWVSASDERSGAVYWKHKTLFKPRPIDLLEQQLPKLLESGYAIAMQWIAEYNADS